MLTIFSWCVDSVVYNFATFYSKTVKNLHLYEISFWFSYKQQITN